MKSLKNGLPHATNDRLTTPGSFISYSVFTKDRLLQGAPGTLQMNGMEGHRRPVTLIRKMFLGCRSPFLCLLFLLLILSIFASPLLAQQNVGIGTATPDSSAALEIKSIDKGLLIPRMNAQARQGIANPAEGLIVFDTTHNLFFYYADGTWKKISPPILSSPSPPPLYLRDTDGDTRVYVEKNQDEDIIRFQVDSTEKMVLVQNANGLARLEMPNNQSSVFIGDSAGKANSTGHGNTFTGYRSGESNTDGFENTFSGNQAGKANTGGDLNSFYGSYSGTANTGGIQNTFSGAYSGVSNTTGKRNTFTGYQAGESNTGGDLNSFYGSYSGASNTGGIQNTFNGAYSGTSNSMGNGNTFSGYQSGEYNTGGAENTYVGFRAGSAGTSGNYNVHVGAWAGEQSTGSGNVFVGYEAGQNETGSNKLYIENSSADSSNALIYGEFDNDILVLNASVGIGTTTPDPSAALEMKSTNKGLLIPRMDSTARKSIPSPAEGLMVFDSTARAFYYYAQSSWTQIGTSSYLLADADNDTKIQLEKNPDEDIIRFSLAGTEKMVLIQNDFAVARLEMPGNGGSVFIGDGAGDKDDGTNNGNVAIGYQAGLNNSSGNENTFTGYRAGRENTMGIRNTFTGSQAGQSNTIGIRNTFTGNYAGQANSLGNENTFTGNWAGANNTSGNNNTFYGATTGHNNTTGELNTFIGQGAGVLNEDGDQNVYVGASAGRLSGTNSSGNVFLGFRAGFHEQGSNKLYIENSDADSSMALIYGEFDKNLLALNASVGIGTNAPHASAALDITASGRGLLIPRMDSTARKNIPSPAGGLMVFDTTAQAFYYYAQSSWTQIGTSSYLLADADDDTKIQLEKNPDEDIIRFSLGGTEKMILRQNTNGLARLEMPNNQSSLFIGSNTGRNATLPSEFNVVLGHHAAYNGINGSANTIVGAFAGDSTTSGEENTFMGYYAGNDNTAGDYNTFCGSSAGFQNRTGSHNVYVGHYAGANNPGGSGNVCIGNEAGRSETGSNRLYIENSNADAANALIYGEFDNNILVFNTPNGYMEIQGAAADAKMKFGGNGGDIHHISSATAMVFNSDNTGKASQDPLFVFRATDYSNLSNYTNLMTIQNNGRVGIGNVINPNARLHVDADAAKPGGGSWTSLSDRRFKQNIHPYTDGLDKVLAIRPVSYRYNKASGYGTETEYVGVIAQELQEVAPYMVSSYQREGTEYLNVDNSAMLYMLINAVQEQQAIITRQQAERKQLLERMAILETQMEAQMQAQRQHQTE